MSVDPALRFWLDWAETRGAACERRDDVSVLLLPSELSRRLDLPEEFLVTSEPEVARDDGALLIATGHPAVVSAADEVLAAGDVGRIVLAPPGGSVPTAAALLDKAREEIPVDHGRLDLSGEPVPRLFPMLRVGALVTYQVSAHDRLQERSELWIDVETAVTLPQRIADRLVTAALDAGTGPAAVPDLVVDAFAAARRAIQTVAARRAAELADQNEPARRAEADRTRAYYDALLASLTDRARSATPDRRAGYDARAEATRVERTRRLAEIEERFTPLTQIRPFRLHLVYVPGLAVPIDVQRGARRYPFATTWLAPAGGFVPRVCPGCGGAEPLVAGKQGLGCRRCLASAALAPVDRPAPINLAAAPEPSGAAVLPTVVDLTRSDATEPPSRPGRREPASTRVMPLRPQPARPAEPPEPEKLSRIGNQLAFGFWQSVAEGSRKHRRQIAAGSPLAALRQLYGPAAPYVAIGMEAGERLDSVESQTWGGWPVVATTCRVTTHRAAYGATLRWRLDSDRPAIVELLPSPYAVTSVLPVWAIAATGVLPRLLAPEFVAQPDQVDDVVARLRQTVLRWDGVPLFARCVAAWWDSPELEETLEVVAAALRYEVGRRSGRQLTYAEVCETYRVDDRPLRRLVGQLRRVLDPCW